MSTIGKIDGIVILVCEPCDFVMIVNDPPPRERPKCPSCKQPTVHASPETYKRIIERTEA